ncbi:hypothetical protein NCS52_01577200 [Fusarium sp. LHS14.1]|nr:hypothetical protein NCS52_01577200 [Fusarium sp. LHS14.1]
MALSPSPPFGSLRRALPADVPRIGIVATGGYRYSPVFKNERPNHADFAGDTLLSYRHEFLSLIESREHIVFVATDKFDPNEGKMTKAIIPADDDWPMPEPDDEVVIGVACWKLSPESDRKGSIQNDNAHYPKLPENRKRDMNEDYCDALEACCQEAEKRYFNGLPTMEALVVHPAYWRRGHGSRLVQQGIDHLAKLGGANHGVIAAETGKPLYLQLGYEELEELVYDDVHLSIMQYQVKSC